MATEMTPDPGCLDEQVLETSRDVLSQRVGREMLLVHLKTDEMFELNDSGARIWELLLAGHSRAEILRQLLQEFDVSQEVLEADLEKVLISFQDASLLLHPDP